MTGRDTTRSGRKTHRRERGTAFREGEAMAPARDEPEWSEHWMTWVTLAFTLLYRFLAFACIPNRAGVLFFGTLSGSLIVSFAVRSRLMIPLTAIGAGLGLFFDSKVKGG